MRQTRGLRSVFRFTAKQYLQRNGFLRTTIIFAVLLFAGAGAIMFFMGKPKSKKEEEKHEIIGTVQILNNAGVENVIPDPVLDEETGEDISDWKFEIVTGKEEDLFEKTSEKDDRILAVVEKATEKGKTVYRTRLLIPKDSKIKKGQAAEAGDLISDTVRTSVYKSVNMSQEMIEFICLEPTTRSITTDEEVSLLNMLIKGILPAILGLVMYMLILLHGQTICKEVSIEKTSKLMETMLVSVEPNALILGKTLALTALAIGQFFIWVISAVAGLFGGVLLGKAVYADNFVNKLGNVLNYLRNFIGESALSPAAIVMSVIVFCFGIFIYFALAAIGGSFVAKPEETASANSVFVFPMIVFWIITYFASMTNAEDALRILRYIPFSAPFCVPVDVVTGNMSLLGGLIVCVEVTAVALLLIFLAARIYRGLMLHTGQKVSLKRIWAVICGK